MDGRPNANPQQPPLSASARVPASVPTPGKSAPVNLATLFRRRFTIDTPATESLWRRHFQGDLTADSLLFEHYAPLICIIAGRLNRRCPHLFTEGFDWMLSDGALGLLNAIRLNRVVHAGFRLLARREIRKSLFREMQTRRWGGRRRAEKLSVMDATRGRLTADLGRLPTPGEMQIELRKLLGHVGNFFVHGEPEIYSHSATADSGAREIDVAGPADSPLDRILDAEAVRLAKKGLSRVDQKILTMLLQGKSRREIAEATKIPYSKIGDRLNGVLWESRCRADLAQYLGVQAARMPKKISHGHWPAIESAPPARRAIGA